MEDKTKKIRKQIDQVIAFLNGTSGSLKEKTIRSGMWVGASSIGLYLLQFLRTVILVRLLTPEAFGILGLCLIVTRAVTVLTETGFNAALIQRKDFEEARDTGFTMTVIRGFVLTAIASLLSPIFAHYYNMDMLTPAIIVLSLGFIVEGFYNINAIAYQRNLDFKKLTYIDYLSSLIHLFVVVVAAYIFKSFWALILSQVINSVLKTGLSYVILADKPHFKFNRQVALELFRYGKFIGALTIVGFISTEAVNAIIGKTLGVEALGYYMVALTLANLPLSHFSQVLMKVMFPVYSSLQDDLSALKEAYIRVLKLVTIFVLPLAAVMITIAPEIVIVLYGEKWFAAIEILRILSLYACIHSIGSLNGWVFNAIGKPDIPFKLHVVRVALMLVMIFPLMKKFQIIGAAFSMTIPMILYTLISASIFHRQLKIKLTEIAMPIMKALSVSCLIALLIVTCRQFFVTANNMFALTMYLIIGLTIFLFFHYRDIVTLVRHRV